MIDSMILGFQDPVDIMISEDPDIEAKLTEIVQDYKDDVMGNPLREAAEEEMECDDCDVDDITIDVDPHLTSENVPPVTAQTSYDMAADALIDAYYDITHGQSMDTGTMIDIVAES